jgi:hypothetical protein
LFGEAKYGAVLQAVPRALTALTASDEHAGLAFGLAERGAAAALVLDKPADFLDDVVKRFVESEPPHVVDGVVPFISLLTACSFAPRPVGKRCIDRVAALRKDGRLPTIFAQADTVLAGAARFVEGDYAGAAKAWRTMLRAPAFIQEPMRNPMAIAFDRSGSPELAEEVDASAVALVDHARTADIAWVRAARRAVKRGDAARAQKLAQATVDKWRFADEDFPAMREMKALAAKKQP